MWLPHCSCPSPCYSSGSSTCSGLYLRNSYFLFPSTCSNMFFTRKSDSVFCHSPIDKHSTSKTGEKYPCGVSWPSHCGCFPTPINPYHTLRSFSSVQCDGSTASNSCSILGLQSLAGHNWPPPIHQMCFLTFSIWH